MDDITSGFHPSPAAQDLAEALRRDVGVRRRAESPEGGIDEARLRAFGDLEGVPPLAKPGAIAPIVKLARKVLQVFLRPWLAAQTVFNTEAARSIGDTGSAVRDHARRLPHLEGTFRHLESRIEQLEASLAENGERNHRAARAPALDAAAIARMFVHSRLPQPPARTIIIGPDRAGIALDLASFGFQVWLGDEAVEHSHPRLRRYRGATTSLPFADATFDLAIDVAAGIDDEGSAREEDRERVWTEIARVLRPGGRVLAAAGSGVFGADNGEAPWPRRALRLNEVVVGRFDGDHWDMSAGSPAVAGPGPAAHGLVLVHATRDAPDR